jgi:hypothetical protein
MSTAGIRESLLWFQGTIDIFLLLDKLKLDLLMTFILWLAVSAYPGPTF